MPSLPLPDDPFALLRARLREGVRASTLCIAIMGWLCDHPTEPSVAEASLRGGQVWMRLSDERRQEPTLSLLDYLNQIRIICTAVGLTDMQTALVVARARHLLG